MMKTLMLAAFAMIAGSGTVSVQSAIAAEAPQIAGAALNVSDQDRSVKFYTDVMGLKMVTKMKVAQGTEVILSMDGSFKAPIIAITDFPHKAGRETFGRLIFTMADPATFVKTVKTAGYKVEQAAGTNGQPAPQVYFITDPDGYTIEVFQSRGAPPSK